MKFVLRNGTLNESVPLSKFTIALLSILFWRVDAAIPQMYTEDGNSNVWYLLANGFFLASLKGSFTSIQNVQKLSIPNLVCNASIDALLNWSEILLALSSRCLRYVYSSFANVILKPCRTVILLSWATEYNLHSFSQRHLQVHTVFC